MKVWIVVIGVGAVACSVLTDLTTLGSAADGSATDAPATPFEIAPADAPWMIAVDDTSIYWTDWISNVVMSANKVDGSNRIALADGQVAAGFSPQGIALDATSVYWSEISSVRKCAKSGCQNNPQIVATSPDWTANSVTVDSTNVFFGTQEGYVFRVSTSGGPLTQLGHFDQSPLDSITSDDSSVYVSFDDGSIRKVPKTGGGVQTDAGTPNVGTVLTGSGSPQLVLGMVVVGTRVYFSNLLDLGQINYVSVDGFASGTGVIATQQSFPAGLASDGTDIYWADYGNYLDPNATGTIMKCSFASCTPTVIAPTQRLPRSVAVDDQAIYWETGGNGSSGGIWRLPK